MKFLRPAKNLGPSLLVGGTSLANARTSCCGSPVILSEAGPSAYHEFGRATSERNEYTAESLAGTSLS